MNASFLTESQLIREFAERPGLIPISVAHAQGQVVWLDLGTYHCYEGFFDQSVATYSALLRTPPACFLAPIDLLGSIPLGECLPPAGFIFHHGRCGSTLLAKVLARSRHNMVFSEAAAHNEVWKVPRQCQSSAVELYRNLVLSMGRRRLASHRSHFIKFTSYNIMQFTLIRAAFPDTPALFLFRDPGAVLESFDRRKQPWLGKDIGLGQTWRHAGEALQDFCRAALAIQDTRFRCLDYADLCPAHLPAVLKFFGTEPSPGDLALMEPEFGWDAKSGLAARRFVPKGSSTAHADERLLRAFRELAARSRSDWE